MNTNPDYISVRYRTESGSYSFKQRLSMWLKSIVDWKDSFPEFPKKEHRFYVEVKEGEPGYDDATHCNGYIISKNPIRYTLNNGTWEKWENDPS